MPCHRPFLTQSYAFSHVCDDMAAVFFLIGRIKLSHKAVSTVKIRTAYYKRKPYRASMFISNTKQSQAWCNATRSACYLHSCTCLRDPDDC